MASLNLEAGTIDKRVRIRQLDKGVEIDASSRFLRLDDAFMDPESLQFISWEHANRLPEQPFEDPLPVLQSDESESLEFARGRDGSTTKRRLLHKFFSVGNAGILCVRCGRDTASQSPCEIEVHYFAGNVTVNLHPRDQIKEDQPIQMSCLSLAGASILDFEMDPLSKLPRGLWKALAKKVAAPEAALRLLLPNGQVIAKKDSTRCKVSS
jgi:hypothetical protein